jgi:hypothetical protein
VSDLDLTVLAIPYGHGFRLITRYSACAMFSLARMSGRTRDAQFWQSAMTIDEVV